MSLLQVDESSLAHHVLGVITELANTSEKLRFAAVAVDDATTGMQSDADADELRKAAYTIRASAFQLLTLALAIVANAGALEAYAEVRTSAESERDEPEPRSR